MLIYNDASRLADQLDKYQTGQPATSRLRLSNDIKTLTTFARRAYSSAMDSQRTILRDLLDGAQGFGNCTTAPYKAACEAAVSDATHHLRTVYKQWKPILSNPALLQSVGSLLATLISKIIADVEDLPDISEADSKQLQALIESVSEIRDLFSFKDDDGEDGTVRDQTPSFCPNWIKFQYLGEIMVSSLADIKYSWHEGGMNLDFGPEEVVGLIEALFADSPLRRAAIGEIRRSAAGRM
jgi:centromere/kinetochore protein ZW10